MKTTTASARTLVIIDCDERTENMLRKCLNRLGIGVSTLCRDAGSLPSEALGVVIELDQFESPMALAEARDRGIHIVALSHHETLSQIQCAIRMGATAMLNKPITQSSVYTTLMMAQGLREQLNRLERENGELMQANLARPAISKAVARLMIDCGIDEQEAFERIRALSMSLNLSIEAICRDIETHTPPLRIRK
ncbi:hypothetical protein RE428_31500 [Marinobacter nanhaiticus D15-8W]|uniref:ANTAR domain-containing protein n=1 Tax=Marinobacter nanhaiticus D15-8W TaxID=626887 RepID=N6W424_9GAMM|nr:ANTAR domain-containing protein [Marinobacter nanhaiticus]ENO17265.1 ANTAR domain-containing protein [Marinobacter nanhaiticus D15-8W]BES72132.1 hypothetical protein RE428_31500 [Marinobacter nanhaiticus D15-8W]